MLKDLLELLTKYPPLLVIAVGLALWVGKGAFFAWHDAYAKFRNRRINDSRDLAQQLALVAPSMSAALVEELEAALFLRFVGVRVARAKRKAAIALFETVGQPAQFGLLRRAWSYLIFVDGDSPPAVKELSGWRHWRHVGLKALFLLSMLCAVVLFVLTALFWSTDQPLALQGAIEIPGFIFICYQLLQSVLAYRDAREIRRIATLPRVDAGSGTPPLLSSTPATVANNMP